MLKHKPLSVCQPVPDLLLVTSHVLSTKFLLQANLNAVMLLIPLPKGSGINLDDGILDQGLCPDLHV